MPPADPPVPVFTKEALVFVLATYDRGFLTNQWYYQCTEYRYREGQGETKVTAVNL